MHHASNDNASYIICASILYLANLMMTFVRNVYLLTKCVISIVSKKAQFSRKNTQIGNMYVMILTTIFLLLRNHQVYLDLDDTTCQK